MTSHRGSESDIDLAVLGGGLAGALVALAVAARHPRLRLALIEQDQVGGNHIWSHFAADVDAADAWLVEPLVTHRWDAYDVAFPGFSRRLDASYRSITSERLAEVVHDRLPPGSIVRAGVAAAQPDRVRLDDGRVIYTRAVLDARGPGDLGLLRLGYQKFAGQLLHTGRPHGVVRPLVIDATVEQRDGYRFVYLLPFGPQEVFVEDTYYSDTPDVDVGDLQHRIAAYATTKGWAVERTTRAESGVLPVVMAGDFERYWASTGIDLAKAGMRAGLFHPTTGYSLPDAIRLASLVAAADDLSHSALLRLTHDHAARTWTERGFYRLLDTMLFDAAEPTERYRVLEHFYRRPVALVHRFYSGRSTRADQLRILSGRPPVPVHRAIRSIAAAYRRPQESLRETGHGSGR